MGETRVDLQHLLEDLRDAYPGALEETILTEMVANSLDSGAAAIRLDTDPARSALTVRDDGIGMQRGELRRYHDVAATTKKRGEGIGFAGVGIKLGLLVSESVFTETRRGRSHVASLWHLASRRKAPWKWMEPLGLVAERGTAVRLTTRNPLSPLLDAGYLEGTLRLHFQPLLDPAFRTALSGRYPKGVRFEVNGIPVTSQSWHGAEVAPIDVRLPRHRKPSGLGYLVREPLPLPEERRGITICTLGKVIKHGWDWLGISPLTPDRIGGLLEVPALSECLTLNKADFIRSGVRGGVYLRYRKAIQEAVARQLVEWGNARDVAEEARRRVARPLERDLERVLMDLADDFPLIASLVEHRSGGQRRLAIGRNGLVTAPATAPEAAGDRTGFAEAAQQEPRAETATATETPPAEDDHEPEPLMDRLILPAAAGARQRARLGLSIQFEDRPGDPEPGRLVESTVWVNTSHPAYRRAVASRSEGYHVALSVALAIAPLAVEPASEHAFINAFLTQWGALASPTDLGRRR